MLTPAARQLLATLAGYGAARGWSTATAARAQHAVATVLSSGHDLGQPPWDAASLRRFLNERRLVALRAIEFLTDAGLTRRGGPAAPGRWLDRQLAALHPVIAAETRIWVQALQGRGPRPSRPRKATTIQGYLRILAAPLAAWSARYESLRQVTTDDLASQLDLLTGATRHLALSAMRSLFATLKARRVLFTNPAAPLTSRTLQPPPVLPLTATRRAGLLASLDSPAEQLIALLAGIHALRPSQISALRLDAADPAAATLITGGRRRPLDQLTTSCLHAWLHARHARWPATANPYLLVNRSTAGGLQPVSRGYIQDTLRRAGITAQDLRADRLLGEAHASGGDPLRLTHLFSVSSPTAIRYCADYSALDSAAPGR